MPSRAEVDAHPERILKEGSGNFGCASTLISNVKRSKLQADRIVTPCQVPEGKMVLQRYLLLASLLVCDVLTSLAFISTLTRAQQYRVLIFNIFLLW